MLAIYFFFICWSTGTAVSSGALVPMLWVMFYNLLLAKIFIQDYVITCSLEKRKGNLFSERKTKTY